MSSARANPEIRAEALEAYKRFGLAQATRESGIPKSTLRRWAREEGLDTSELAGASAAQTEAATEARTLHMHALREDLRVMLLETAVDLLERTNAPHIDFRGKDNAEVEFDRAPAPACREYVWAAGIAIDKFRLEMGESTSRTEVDRGPLEQQIVRVSKQRDELRARREQNEAQAS